MAALRPELRSRLRFTIDDAERKDWSNLPHYLHRRKGIRLGELTPEERAALIRQMKEKLSAIPSVKAVTAAQPIPLDGTIINSRWGKEDAAADPTKFQQASLHIVLPGYFEAMGAKLIAGRTYTDADNRPDFTGVVIDEKLAKKAFPAENAVGKRLFIRSRGQ